MTGRLWLIRHGRTAWNGGRFLGRADVPLSESGLEQAAAAARLLAGETLDRVWTSPLRRAAATATVIAAAQRCPRPLPIENADLLELDCGSWEGRLKGPTKISKRDPYEQIPGGESVYDVWCRADRFADILRGELADGLRVAVVGHYLTSQLLRALLLGRPLAGALHDQGFRPVAGSVHEVTVHESDVDEVRTGRTRSVRHYR